MFRTVVFLTDLAGAQAPTVRQLQVLSDTERDRAGRLQSARRQQFVAGRLLLRHAVEQLTGSAPGDVREREGLPPALTGPEGDTLRLSISHSRHLVGVAVTDRGNTDAPPDVELGFDIEYQRPIRDYAAATFFCTDAELEALTHSVNEASKTALYYRLWTQKEAAYKAVNERDPSATLKCFCSQEEPLAIRATARLYTAALAMDGCYHLALYRSRCIPTEHDGGREAVVRTIWMQPDGIGYRLGAGPEPSWSRCGVQQTLTPSRRLPRQK